MLRRFLHEHQYTRNSVDPTNTNIDGTTELTIKHGIDQRMNLHLKYRQTSQIYNNFEFKFPPLIKTFYSLQGLAK